MSGAPIDVDFQNPLNMMNPNVQQFNPQQQMYNPHQISGQQVAYQRGNPQHQFNPQQMHQMQNNLTRPQPPFLQPESQLPPTLQQQTNPPNQFPTQYSNLTPDQQARINQVNNMSQNSFQQNMTRISQMNDQIMAHHMSNMSSYQDQPSAPEFAGEIQAAQHVSFPQQIASDHAPTSYERNAISGFASLESESTMPGSQAPPNQRGCECKPKQQYCAACQICGMPGHRRKYPGPMNWTGQWCDPHYERERREAMKKYPDLFQSFSAPHNPNIDSASGYYSPQQADALAQAHMNTNRPYRQVGGAQVHPMEHHPDRYLGGQPQNRQQAFGGATRSSPYQLNASNIDNFKGNNPFMLNRTSVDQSLLKPKEAIDFAGYNAQGEKVRNKKYYNVTPGRQNEFDYYREYKKLNNADFVPCNEDSMNSNYRPFQSGIPPKRVKLNKNALQQQMN